jgi:hypothetical protein
MVMWMVGSCTVRSPLSTDRAVVVPAPVMRTSHRVIDSLLPFDSFGPNTALPHVCLIPPFLEVSYDPPIPVDLVHAGIGQTQLRSELRFRGEEVQMVINSVSFILLAWDDYNNTALCDRDVSRPWPLPS